MEVRCDCFMLPRGYRRLWWRQGVIALCNHEGIGGCGGGKV